MVAECSVLHDYIHLHQLRHVRGRWFRVARNRIQTHVPTGITEFAAGTSAAPRHFFRVRLQIGRTVHGREPLASPNSRRRRERQPHRSVSRARKQQRQRLPRQCPHRRSPAGSQDKMAFTALTRRSRLRRSPLHRAVHRQAPPGSRLHRTRVRHLYM